MLLDSWPASVLVPSGGKEHHGVKKMLLLFFYPFDSCRWSFTPSIHVGAFWRERKHQCVSTVSIFTAFLFLF